MATRNSRIVRDGQPEIPHYCDKCMRTFPYGDSLYKVEAVVTDGLTIGHPCCLVFTCKEPLANNRHRFCLSHAHLRFQCSIVGCTAPVAEYSTVSSTGKTTTSHAKTCPDPLHQEIERLNKEQSRANFQLSQKLMRQKVGHPNIAVVDQQVSDLTDLEDIDEWYEVDPTGGEVRMFSVNNPGATGILDSTRLPTTIQSQAPCPTHPEQGNRKVKAQFGRRRTHNEQIVVRPCGVICSRATLFGAEAVSNVLVSSLSVYQCRLLTHRLSL